MNSHQSAYSNTGDSFRQDDFLDEMNDDIEIGSISVSQVNYGIKPDNTSRLAATISECVELRDANTMLKSRLQQLEEKLSSLQMELNNNNNTTTGHLSGEKSMANMSIDHTKKAMNGVRVDFEMNGGNSYMNESGDESNESKNKLYAQIQQLVSDVSRKEEELVSLREERDLLTIINSVNNLNSNSTNNGTSASSASTTNEVITPSGMMMVTISKDEYDTIKLVKNELINVQESENNLKLQLQELNDNYEMIKKDNEQIIFSRDAVRSALTESRTEIFELTTKLNQLNELEIKYKEQQNECNELKIQLASYHHYDNDNIPQHSLLNGSSSSSSMKMTNMNNTTTTISNNNVSSMEKLLEENMKYKTRIEDLLRDRDIFVNRIVELEKI